MTIVKTGSGYQVKSEHKGKGGKTKNLSKPNLTKGEAVQRLRTVEYYKHKGGK